MKIIKTFLDRPYLVILIAALIALVSPVNAQIAEVKIEGSYARIYNEQSNYTGRYINLCSNCELFGYNSKFIVIKEGGYVRIYNDQGNYTGKYINLCADCYVKNVGASAILVKEGSYTRYYDFEGNYTGKSTNN